MEGYLIPYAPPVENPRKPSQSTTVRLMVLRNGDKDPGAATPLVGPDLTNVSMHGRWTMAPVSSYITLQIAQYLLSVELIMAELALCSQFNIQFFFKHFFMDIAVQCGRTRHGYIPET
jgi:hypothetical protein